MCYCIPPSMNIKHHMQDTSMYVLLRPSQQGFGVSCVVRGKFSIRKNRKKRASSLKLVTAETAVVSLLPSQALSTRSPLCLSRTWCFGFPVNKLSHGPPFARRLSLSVSLLHAPPCTVTLVPILSGAAASRNKYVVVGLGGATVRMSARLDSPVLRTLPQGTVRAMKC